MAEQKGPVCGLITKSKVVDEEEQVSQDILPFHKTINRTWYRGPSLFVTAGGRRKTKLLNLSGIYCGNAESSLKSKYMGLTNYF